MSTGTQLRPSGAALEWERAMAARRLWISALVFLPATLAAPVPMFVFPEPVPVERLVKNLATLIEKNPRDHALLYNMARVHYLALANLSFLVPAYESAKPFPRAEADAHGGLEVPAGVRYRDGRMVPTFDWVTRPLAATAGIDPPLALRRRR